MNEQSAPTLYIRLRKQVKVRRGESILFRQVAQFVCEPEMEQQLNQLILYEPQSHDGNAKLIDMLMIVKQIKKIKPAIQIEYFGAPHALVEIVSKQQAPNLFFLIAVCFLLFIGSGLAIMNFHADVSMVQVHRRIYELITGHKTMHPYILQISYSFGIGIGMILFFNHWLKKKWNEEPSPLDVEMYLYQENVNDVMITEEYNKMNKRRDHP